MLRVGRRPAWARRGQGTARAGASVPSQEDRLSRLLPASWLAAMRTEAGTRREPPSEVVHASRHRIRVATVVGPAASSLLRSVESSGVLRDAPLVRLIGMVHDVVGTSLCITYWLLVGLRPFEAQDESELIHQHLHVAPRPLSERASQPIPALLEAVVMDCLARDPAGRPGDADELSVRLEMSVPGKAWTAADAGAWWNGRAMRR